MERQHRAPLHKGVGAILLFERPRLPVSESEIANRASSKLPLGRCSRLRILPHQAHQILFLCQIERDEAFCDRMRRAIAAGLENAPIGVVTTPGTKNPKYVPTERLPRVSSQHDMEHA